MLNEIHLRSLSIPELRLLSKRVKSVLLSQEPVSGLEIGEGFVSSITSTKPKVSKSLLNKMMKEAGATDD